MRKKICVYIIVTSNEEKCVYLLMKDIAYFPTPTTFYFCDFIIMCI